LSGDENLKVQLSKNELVILWNKMTVQRKSAMKKEMILVIRLSSDPFVCKLINIMIKNERMQVFIIPIGIYLKG
jgi:hypothetical protein